jgi:predicted nucleotidyltransferase
MKKTERLFNRLCKEAKKDPNIIGFLLSGSRGKGLATKYSDYDIEIIVKDRSFKSYKKTYEKMEIKNFGFTVFSYSGFKKHAAIGSPFEWDRYSYAHIKVLIDKNDKIQKLVDEKGEMPKEKIRDYVSGHLDGYINYLYRSLKCFRDGDIVGARLEAARSIHLFLNVIFGLEGRITPYYKYLEWELENFPLEKFSMKPKEIIKSLLRVLENADIKTQQKLLKLTERVCRKEGYGHVFDSWGPSLKWMETYKK